MLRGSLGSGSSGIVRFWRICGLVLKWEYRLIIGVFVFSLCVCACVTDRTKLTLLFLPFFVIRSVPHPFVSLLSVAKGVKLLPRVFRLTNPQQTLTILTLLVATFDTLDVVKDASILDGVAGIPGVGGGGFDGRRAAAELETEAFLSSAVPVLMSTIGVAPMRIVSGMVSLLIKRNNVVRVAKSRVKTPFLFLIPKSFDAELGVVSFFVWQAGVALLTIFLTRAEILKQGADDATVGQPAAAALSPEDLSQWFVLASLFRWAQGI
jgi:hypothetical protein